MQFRSELQLPPSDWTISHQSGVIAMGSCFAGLLGRYLQQYKFRTLVNPFGVIYNPVALARPILAAL
ncbi:MAG: GSCFA domain-containing protein, partial [Bacteroidota bacterium]